MHYTRTITIPTKIKTRNTILYLRLGSLYKIPPKITDITVESCFKIETPDTNTFGSVSAINNNLSAIIRIAPLKYINQFF